MERLSYEMAAALQYQPGVKLSVLRFRGPRLLSPLFNIMVTPGALAFGAVADVIYLGDPMLAWVGWLVKKILHKPVAVTVHGLDITYGNFFYRYYLRLFGTKFDWYWPISEKVNQLLRQLVPDGQTKIISPGVVDRHYNPSFGRTALSKIIGREVADKVVLFTCGRLVERKGHAWFVANVLKDLPENVIYVVAGDGPERDKIERVIKLYQMQQRVIMLGRISDQDLKILYNTVDAFIQPNVAVKNDVEGFGLAMLEAALCCRMVFAADIDGIPGAIQSGKNGWLLPAENSQAWVAALKEYVQSPTVNVEARNYTLEKFSWDEKAKEIVTLLNC